MNGEFIDREKVVPGVGISHGKPNSKTIPPVGLQHVSASMSGFNIGVLSTKILSANKLRAYLLIQNKSAAIVYFCFSASIDQNNFNALEIPPGGNFEVNTNGRFCIASEVHLKGAIGNQNVVIVEGLFIIA